MVAIATGSDDEGRTPQQAALHLKILELQRAGEKERQMVRRLPSLGERPEFSEELNKKVRECDEQRNGVVERFNDLINPVIQALENALEPFRADKDSVDVPTTGFADLFSTIDCAKLNKIVELEAAAGIAEKVKALVPECAEVLAKTAKEADENVLKVLETVKDDMRAIQQDERATPAGQRNLKEAERQFTFQARMNPRCQAARLDASHANQRLAAYRDAASRAKELREDLAQSLLEIATRGTQV